jgi:hypothetical protein
MLTGSTSCCRPAKTQQPAAAVAVLLLLLPLVTQQQVLVLVLLIKQQLLVLQLVQAQLGSQGLVLRLLLLCRRMPPVQCDLKAAV